MNRLVKVIVLVNLAVWQVCRFPHYRLSMRGGNKKPYEHFARFILGRGPIQADICVPLFWLLFFFLVVTVVEMIRPSIHNI